MVICIAGKNDIASNALEYLVDKYGSQHVIVLPNQNDPGFHTWTKSFKQTAIENDVEIVSTLEDLYNIKDLVFISIEFDKIIDIKKFNSDQLYNIHFSLLPKYKGVYTSAWHILNAEERAGVTLHMLDNGIDTGDIIDQKSFQLNKTINCRDLYIMFNKYGFELFKKNISRLINKRNITVKRQPFLLSTYYSKSSIDYKNLRINLQKTAFEIDSQIRAFYFPEYQIPKIHNYPVKSSKILLKRSIKKPGTLLEDRASHFVISTIDYDLKIQKE